MIFISYYFLYILLYLINHMFIVSSFCDMLSRWQKWEMRKYKTILKLLLKYVKTLIEIGGFSFS